ncbi:sensor histidine kinase, partial [Priestia filamentosa]
MNKFELSIKRWFLIFLIIFLVIPILTTRVVVDIYERFNSPYKDYELESLDVWMTNHVLNDVDEWGNLGWQKSISEETDKIGITLKLVNEDNQVLFSNINNKNQYELNTDISKEDAQISNIVEEYPVYTQVKLKGVAYMQDNRIDNFNPMPSQWMYYLINEWGGAFVWLSIFIAILIISTKFIKKKMLYPLREFQKATDSISHQNFNFSVPYTPIKELNELSDAILIMQRTLKQSLDRQTQMEKERKIFISSIIHDLRTPLFSIRGYLEGIKKG